MHVGDNECNASNKGTVFALRAMTVGERGRMTVDEGGASSDTDTQAVGVANVDPVAEHHLTPRQAEVLRLLARGWTDAQIADELFLSRRTVHAHLREIFRKLAVSHRSAATRYAIEHGLA
jgi:DNA-binding NarL/FixJ family response regulator